MVWFGLHGHLQGGQTPNLRRHPSRHLRTRCNVLRLEFKLVRPPRAKSSEGKGRKGKEGGEREGEPQSEQERGRREGSRPKEAPGQANTQPRAQLRQLATNSRPGGKKTKQRGERQRASRPLFACVLRASQSCLWCDSGCTHTLARASVGRGGCEQPGGRAARASQQRPLQHHVG